MRYLERRLGCVGRLGLRFRNVGLLPVGRTVFFLRSGDLLDVDYLRNHVILPFLQLSDQILQLCRVELDSYTYIVLFPISVPHRSDTGEYRPASRHHHVLPQRQRPAHFFFATSLFY